MPDPQNESSEPEQDSPEAMARALELELISKRPGWQKARERRRTWRTLSILFVIFILLGALATYFYLTSELGQERKPATPASQSDR